MYDIAVTVGACLRAGTRVDVAWAVEVSGFGPVDHNEALAITPGGGRVGSLASGALDDQLVDLSDRGPHLAVSTSTSASSMRWSPGCPARAGRGASSSPRRTCRPTCGIAWSTVTRCAWLRDSTETSSPVTTCTTPTPLRRRGGRGALFRAGSARPASTRSRSSRCSGRSPSCCIVGGGPIAEALGRAAELLGWQVRSFTESGEAAAQVVGLSGIDSVVVFSHDDELTGPALRAALSSPVGYIGALGSRPVQESRADWLVRRGVNDLARIHGPAGLDIGASTPAEIAVSILAQSLAVRAGLDRSPLSGSGDTGLPVGFARWQSSS